MIGPERRDELVDDIQKRTGLKIEKLEVEQIDLVRDTAKIKIYYICLGRLPYRFLKRKVRTPKSITVGNPHR